MTNVHGTRDYYIRSATPEDVAALPEIERLAGYVFRSYPQDLGISEDIFENPNTVDTFATAQGAGLLWVAVASGGEPVGFALVMEMAGYAHLEEIDVLPSYGGKGIGSALLGTVCSWAKERGYPAVTLRTFRDVPWNAPFYHRRGFRVVDSATLSPAHERLELAERKRGLRTDMRVTMVYEILGQEKNPAGLYR